MIGKEIRDAILRDISAKEYRTIAFTLKCSRETLAQRYKKRGDKGEVSYDWLDMEPHEGDYGIDTDHKSIAQVVAEMKAVIDSVR